jgi:hypothetical protein
LPPTPTSTFFVIVLITRGVSSGPALADLILERAGRVVGARPVSRVGVAIAAKSARLVAASFGSRDS